jgi:hypothetical protein
MKEQKNKDIKHVNEKNWTVLQKKMEVGVAAEQ